MKGSGQNLLEVLLCVNLHDTEIKLLNGLYESRGFKVIQWKTKNKIPDTDKKSIIFNSEFSESSLTKSLQKKTGVVGRLSSFEMQLLQETGIPFYWHPDKHSLQHIPLHKVSTEYSPTLLVITNDVIFNRKIKDIFQSISWKVVIVSGFKKSLALLQSGKIDLCVIDWDCDDENLDYFLTMQKDISSSPLYIGLKDFNRENLFRSLSTGVSKLTNKLFAKQEFIEILINSIPLRPLNRFEPQDQLEKLLLLKEGNKISSFQIHKLYHYAESMDIISLRYFFSWLNPEENPLR